LINELSKNNNTLIKDFNKLSTDEQMKYLNDYHLLKVYQPNEIINILINYGSLEQKITFLRDESFISDMPSYLLEIVLNSMPFNAVFNMLQNKNILDKINLIDVDIKDTDAVIIMGYLDSPTLTFKTHHLMLKTLINNLTKENILTYLNKDYIIAKLTGQDILDIGITNNLNLINLLTKIANTKGINKLMVTNYLNECFIKRIDYTLVDNEYIKKKVLNLTDEEIKNIDFSTAEYLFDLLNTKSVITLQNSAHDFTAFKSVLIASELMDIKAWQKYIENGNKKITNLELRKLENKIIEAKQYEYRIENNRVFDNMANKIRQKLDEIVEPSPAALIKQAYLKRTISIAEDLNYPNAQEAMLNYLKLKDINATLANKCLFNYVNGLTKKINEKVQEKEANNFKNKLLKHFTIKVSAWNRLINNYEKEYLKHLKCKILVNTLLNQQNSYQKYYLNNYQVSDIINNFKTTFKDYNLKDIINNIMIPYGNDKFNINNCLAKMNIEVPAALTLYNEEKIEEKVLFKINHELDNILSHFNNKDKLMILTSLINPNAQLTNKHLLKIREQIAYFTGNVTVSNKYYHLEYTYNPIVSNDTQIPIYEKYVKYIEQIVNKINYFTSKYMNNDFIKKVYYPIYHEYLLNKANDLTINKHNYNMQKRIFSLKDFANVFKDINFADINAFDPDLKKLLIDDHYLIYYMEGYLSGIVPNLNILLYNWQYLKYQDIYDENKQISILKLNKIINELNNKRNYYLNNELETELKANDNYQDYLNYNKRIKNYENLMEQMKDKNACSIPNITGITNEYQYSLVDYHSPILLTNNYSINKIDDKLKQILLTSPNIFAFRINNSITNQFVSSVWGQRIGNIVYLGLINNKISDNVIKDLANNIINNTQKSKEPVNFVIVNTNDYINNSLKVNASIVPTLNNPELLNIFKDNNTLLVASNLNLEPHNFLSYQPKILYPRLRGKVKFASGIAPNTIINEISKIKLNILINPNDEIIYGDDWLIVNHSDKIEYYISNDNEEAQKELDKYLKYFKENKARLIKI
jgi:hypothetical protein